MSSSVCVVWCVYVFFFVFFFFKQKTAYEMRISDWSSDVCSSDLLDLELLPVRLRHVDVDRPADRARDRDPLRTVAAARDHDHHRLRPDRASADRKSVV